MPDPLPSRPAAALSGLLAAAAALAAGELVTGFGRRGPSLVTAVGSRFIDAYAARLKSLAVSLFGTNDKTALVVGIVVVCLAFGAGIGVAARRRAAIGVAALGGFALVGLWAYQSDSQARPVVGALACAAAWAAGVGALHTLLRRAPRRAAAAGTDVVDGVADGRTLRAAPRAALATPMTGDSRRRFLLTAGVVGVASAGAAQVGRARRYPDTVRLPANVPLPTVARPATVVDSVAIDGITPWLTPTKDFYRIDTALTVPSIDASKWTLEVRGLVDRPFTIGYEELLALDAVEEVVTMQCVSNEVGGNLIGNARWTGVPLRTLLERAGVRDTAQQVVGRSVDGFTAGFPRDVLAGDRVALVAYAMNGEPLPAAHGFPARLVVAGLYGYVSATKWLRSIDLTTWDGFDGYWISRGWSKEGPIKTASRIDVPRAGATIAPGAVTIAGVAWAPSRGIARVEVSIDDEPWRVASIGDSTRDNAWVQWWLAWDAPPGPHILRVRAVDRTGAVQTGTVRAPDPDGATGWHTRRVTIGSAR